jgi:hypothetical protein
MLSRENNFGVLVWVALAVVALPLVACGRSTRAHEPGRNASGGSGGSSGSSGGSLGGSSGVGGATGGSTATAGSGGDAGAAGSGGAGGGGTGGAEERASFHWIEPTEQHRERAALATAPALLRTVIMPALEASVLIGTSTVIIGENFEETATEAIVWTEATGTIGLGGLPGESDGGSGWLSDPSAVSADGSTVVGRATTSEGGAAPFRWTRADGMEAVVEGDGTAVAVSADGSVVLGEQRRPLVRAFRWTRALGAVTLEPVAGDDWTQARALSADGATVLGHSSGPFGARLFVWTEATGTRAVENLPGYTSCLAAGVTFGRTSGLAVGGLCTIEAGQPRPFVWAGQDVLLALGPADALDGYEPTGPVAVTADGSVAVGRASGATLAAGSRAYRWTQANGLQLIQLPEGYTTGAPVAGQATMSEDGSVFVGTMGGIGPHSFLWSESAGAVVLAPLEGHDMSDAYVLSTDGSVAAGSSFRLGVADEIQDQTAVYWRADGVPHRIADELVAGGVDLGGAALGVAQSTQAPLGFVGFGSKDEVSILLAWHARLPSAYGLE